MNCPTCTTYHNHTLITQRDESHYTFRKYNCNICHTTFHSHEYLQGIVSEPVLKVRLGKLATQLEELKGIVEQMELSL